MTRTRAGTRVGALLLTLSVAGAGAVRGQSRLTVAPRVGVVVSTMEFSDPATDAQTETLVGAQVGIAVGRDLGAFFTGEIALQLSREGFGGGGAHTGDLRRDELAVPILFSVRAPTRISPHLTAGVTGTLALRCRIAGVAVVGDLSCDDSLMGARWKRLDVAGVGGVGVALPVGRRILSVDARISGGLRNQNGRGLIPGSARSVAIGFSIALLSPWGSVGAGGGS